MISASKLRKGGVNADVKSVAPEGCDYRFSGPW